MLSILEDLKDLHSLMKFLHAMGVT